jgi:hypothetical protein
MGCSHRGFSIVHVMTRITLICGSLDSGGDGVGDYCRRIAGELVALGAECLMLGFNDHAVEGEVTESPHPSVQLVRLPARMSLRKRAARAESLLARWEPDWVSLQFVSYAFNRKGLPVTELYWLPRLLHGRKLHIMLHELWVGLGVMRSPKNIVLGTLQRWVLMLLLTRLRPLVLHTSNDYYRAILARYGREASVLPLFSNIPVSAELADHWLADAVIRNGGPDIARRDRFWLLGIFGSIPAGWPSDHFFGRLSSLARACDRRAVVISAGAAGPASASMLEGWRVKHPDLEFVAIGPRPAPEISQFLNSIDFGITPHPIYLLGKSGSVAAMLEHGVPLIATWGDIAPAAASVSSEFEPLIWRDDDALADRLRSTARRHRRPDWSSLVAKTLLSSLSPNMQNNDFARGYEPSLASTAGGARRE